MSTQQTSTDASIFCSQCGTENKASSRFCKNCGTKLGSSKSVQSQDGSKRDSGTPVRSMPGHDTHVRPETSGSQESAANDKSAGERIQVTDGGAEPDSPKRAFETVPKSGATDSTTNAATDAAFSPADRGPRSEARRGRQPALGAAAKIAAFKRIEEKEEDASVQNEPLSAFAHGLPAWSPVPPHETVRRKPR